MLKHKLKLLFAFACGLTLFGCFSDKSRPSAPSLDLAVNTTELMKDDTKIPDSLSGAQAYNLGTYYSRNPSDIKNLAKAVHYIQYSAATGYAEAQFKLGLMYFQGIGVEINDSIGFYWIKKAAKNNYPEAQLYLAYMYRNGIGTQVDMFQANYWTEQAQANGINIDPNTIQPQL